MGDRTLPMLTAAHRSWQYSRKKMAARARRASLRSYIISECNIHCCS